MPLVFRDEIPAQQFFSVFIVSEIERAVFADNTIHRPHAGDVVAPTGGPAGYGNDTNTLVLQDLQGGKHDCGQPTADGEGVVDVG